MERDLLVLAVSRSMANSYIKLSIDIEAATRAMMEMGVPDPKAIVDDALAELAKSLDMQKRLTEKLEADGLDPREILPKLNHDKEYATELLRKYGLISDDEVVAFSEVEEVKHE